jgi:hypothetical protein
MLHILSLFSFKEKLWSIVAASYVVRIIVFLTLPNSPTSLAPDEGSYSEIARRITTSESLNQFGGLSKTSQTLVVPASIFIRMGLDPLSATRLSALMYGFATLAFAAYVISKVAQVHIGTTLEHKKTLNQVLTLFAIYSFLPSHLLWSILALRESTMEFWVILIFGSIFLITHRNQKSNTWNYLVLISSIFLLFNTRLQVGLLLVISLMISLPLIHKARGIRKVFSVVAITSALSFSSLFVQTNVGFKVINLDAPTAVASNVDPALCQKNGQVIYLKASRFLCEEVRKTTLEEITRPDEFIVGQIKSIPDRQEANQANASSAIQNLSCPFENELKTNKIGCLIWRAPYMTATFLIRPIFGLDVTSRSSLFAAVENLLWSAGFIFIFYSILKKRKIPYFKSLLPSILFFILYSVGAGSYEGNMGTAFRHKSLILWVVLLLIFVLAWREPEEARKTKE